MMTLHFRRSSRRRAVALALACLLSVSVLASPASAGNSPLGDAAAPWPSSWDPYGFSDSSPVVDPGDENPGYSDIWGGAGDNLPSVYWSSDGTNVFFRFRIRQDPFDRKGGFSSTVWLVSLGVAGTQAAVLGLNGKGSSIDYVYVTNADGSTVNQIYTTPFSNDGSGTSAGARTLPAPDEGFFIDFQVPIAQITAVAPSVTAATPVQLFYGSSQAANLSVINKDFMVGDELAYTGLATVQPNGEDPPTNNPPDAVDDSATTSQDNAVVTDVLSNDTDPEGDPLTVSAFDATSANGGTVSCTTDGNCTYTPPAGFTGTDSYTYTADDGNGGTDTATVTVTVDPANANPTATDDGAITDEDTSVVTAVLANDTDPDGDPLTVSAFDATSANGGTVSCTTDGNCTYTPPAGFTGTDSYTYTADDGNGGTDTATVTVTVDPANANPTATDDGAITDEDTSVVTAVLANDTDPDGDPLTVSAFDTTSANGGTVSCTTDGNCTYTPPADFSGSDSYTYTADDGNGGTDTATVTVTVNPVNDAPVAGDDNVAVDEDSSVIIPVLADDTDAEGDPLTVTAVSSPAHGSVTINGDNTVTYTPDPDYAGPDVFTYTVCDDGGLCDTATVTVTVDPVNDAPIATDDIAVTAENAAVVTPVLANDTDVDGDTLTVSSFDATSANGGTVSCTAGGDCTYAPPVGFSGTDSYTYTADDSNGGTATATVTVTVVEVNDTPVAVDDNPSTPEDTAIVVAVLSNDTDPDGNTLSIDFFTQPAQGTVTDNLDGTLTYTPPADWSGTTTFLYRICDDGVPSLCDEATVTVTVTAENDPPTANDDSAATDEDTTVVTSVLINDTDIDGDTLTVSSFDATSARGGTVSCTAGGDCTYTPPSGVSGTDSYRYVVSDGNGGTDLGEVTVTVTALNDRPTPMPDSITVTEDIPLDTPAATLLLNDTDPDGPFPLSVDAVTNGSHGTVTLVGGTVTYTPEPNYHGPDAFTYTVCDDAGGCSVETVTVTVEPANDDPVAADDTATTDEDVPVIISVLANDTDVDGDALTVTNVTTPPVSGTATINSGTTITYTPAPNFFGMDEFEYEISDGNGGTTTAWVRFVVVNPVNDAPVADDDTATVNEDEALTIDVLDNDADVEDDPLTVTATSAPANGTVTINGDNTVTYTPDADYFGPDSFTYTVCDTGGLCDTATVSVTVDPVNDAPVAGDDAATAAEDGAVTVAVLGNDSDVEGDSLSVTAVSNPPNGTAVIGGDNTVTYTPNGDYSGPDSFTYTVCDTGGLCDTAIVGVTVVAVNDAPVASDLAPGTAEDVPVTIDVVAGSTDADGDALAVASATMPAHGTVTINGDGTVTYTPEPNFFGSDSFQVTVCDPGGLCDVATVVVSVSAVNDAPIVVDDAVTVPEDTPAVVSVLANDSDIEGDPLTIVSVSDPVGGTTAIVGSVVTYTPDPDFFGTITFTYTVSDGNDGTAVGTVTVVVESVNDPLTYSGPTTLALSVSGVPDPLPAIDGEGDPLTYAVVGGALPPGLVLNPDGTWSGAAEAGTYAVTIEACDDGTPPACSILSLVLQVTLLPATGATPLGAATTAAVLLLMGTAVITTTRRSRPRVAELYRRSTRRQRIPVS